jgi:hypothetical protein
MSNKIDGEELLTMDDYEKAGSTIAEPKNEKRPSNGGLLVALISFNFAFLVVDAISAGVVGYLTHWYYGAATILAGAVFMIVHEYLFTRPFNNAKQRNIAIGGAVWAVLTILGIALTSVIANLTGLTSNGYEAYFLAFMVGVIVLNVIIHGVLTAVYYYIDDGHNAKNKAARARARAITQNEIDDAAEMILTEALRRRVNRKKMVNRYRSPETVRRAIQEAGGDEDGDGIPDWIDPVDNRTGKPFQQRPVMAQNVKQENLKENPTDRQRPQQ